jgi:DNA modification methylase
VTFQLVSGDCLDALAKMPEASVDAVVTDPPYGLSAEPDAAEVLRHWLDGDDYQHRGGGFMGKTWDSFVPGPKVWAECHRVLKPGGHLLAFFGTRTYDLGAMAIRLAGFEVRDCLAWMYGSGFPKSLDVSKAIDRKRDDLDDIYRVTEWIREARDEAGIGNREIDEAFGANGMGRHWTDVRPNGKQPAVPTLDQVPQLLDVLGVDPDDVPQEIRRLLYDLNGKKGQPGENWAKREVVGERAQRGSPNGVAPFNTADSPVELLTAPATPAAQKWQGWGTALKPAFEPVILARKPLTGTVAATVQEFGTGALNIDGGRVGTDGGTTRSGEPDRLSPQGAFTTGHQVAATDDFDWEGAGMEKPSSGRWPANIILDPEAGALLDEMSGERPGAVGMTQHGSGTNKVYGDWHRSDESTGGEGRRDTGGASRYFYCAKASRAERNAGLDGFEEQQIRRHSGGEFSHNSGSTNSSKNGAESRNSHPTVKPLDLMRYLVRLVTPPGGTVLDPFTGSGTTGIAAGLEGFDFIGIEREAEYREIAEARLKWWADKQGETAEILRRAGLAEKEREQAEAVGQVSLFDEAA